MAKTTANDSALALRSRLSTPAVQQRIQAALRVADMQPKQFMGACYRAICANPTILGKCSPESMLDAMVEAGHTGYVPGVGGLAYFIPRGARCCYELSYLGFIQLAYKHPRVLNIEPHVVYEMDDFDVDYGRRPPVHHRPTSSPNQGAILGVWVLTELAGEGGAVGRNYAHYWTHDLLARHRARSQSWQYAEKEGKTNTPWHTDEAAMLMKSAVKDARKFIPFTTELALQIQREEDADRGESSAFSGVPAFEDESQPPIDVQAHVSKPQPQRSTAHVAEVDQSGELEGDDQVF